MCLQPHVYSHLLTIADMVKQLNYVWLTAEITVTTTKYIKYIISLTARVILSITCVEVLL